MFTWKPIYAEVANRLLAFRDSNHDLVDMVAKMQKAELKVLAITDQAADGRQFPLNEIDPFTFFANFNRGTTADHRTSILRFIKEEWKLTAALPEDYSGLPLVNPMKSWFMPFEKSRDPGHVPQLWQFYGHILEVSSAFSARCGPIR